MAPLALRSGGYGRRCESIDGLPWPILAQRVVDVEETEVDRRTTMAALKATELWI